MRFIVGYGRVRDASIFCSRYQRTKGDLVLLCRDAFCEEDEFYSHRRGGTLGQAPRHYEVIRLFEKPIKIGRRR